MDWEKWKDREEEGEMIDNLLSIQLFGWQRESKDGSQSISIKSTENYKEKYNGRSVRNYKWENPSLGRHSSC
jgi:hypothetical protein